LKAPILLKKELLLLNEKNILSELFKREISYFEFDKDIYEGSFDQFVKDLNPNEIYWEKKKSKFVLSSF